MHFCAVLDQSVLGHDWRLDTGCPTRFSFQVGAVTSCLQSCSNTIRRPPSWSRAFRGRIQGVQRPTCDAYHSHSSYIFRTAWSLDSNNSVTLVRERTILTEQPPLVVEVSATIANGGRRVVSATDSHGCILGFLDRMKLRHGCKFYLFTWIYQKVWSFRTLKCTMWKENAFQCLFSEVWVSMQWSFITLSIQISFKSDNFLTSTKKVLFAVTVPRTILQFY
jgi:hypothetical protein